MADFKILERDGWYEVDVSEAEFVLSDLWNAVGKGAFLEAAVLLFNAELLQERNWKDVVGVRVISVPDDIRGEWIRIWVRFKPAPKDWTPQGRRR